MQQIYLKRRHTYTKPHDVKSQTVVPFIAKLEPLKLDYNEGVPLLSEDYRTFRVEGRAPPAL